MRKFKFYLIGFIPGLLVVLFFLNKKGASCSYFPNDRVRAETLTKKFNYSPTFQQQMKDFAVDEKLIKDSMLTQGSIDFDKSNAQAEPCPEYTLVYPKKNPRFELRFSKCKEDAKFNQLKKLK